MIAANNGVKRVSRVRQIATQCAQPTRAVPVQFQADPGTCISVGSWKGTQLTGLVHKEWARDPAPLHIARGLLSNEQLANVNAVVDALSFDRDADSVDSLPSFEVAPLPIWCCSICYSAAVPSAAALPILLECCAGAVGSGWAVLTPRTRRRPRYPHHWPHLYHPINVVQGNG